jgi:hypothetical protein
MACIEKIYSVSALVGNGKCNANCSFCAGKYLRPQAPKTDDLGKLDNFHKNLESAIKLSARYGGWSLSLTGAGEPTVDPDAVTRALEVYSKCADQGAHFPNVNLFTNGILLGDKDFCDTYLPLWKILGLTNVAVSIHSTDRYRQAEAYGLYDYPNFSVIVENVRRHGLGVRATLLLRKGEVDCSKAYDVAIRRLIYTFEIDNITSWPVGNPSGSRNEFTPSRLGLFGIKMWLKRNAKLCHGHAWGGGVYDYNGAILRLTDYVTKHDPSLDFVRQLVVFQDGLVAYSWIKEGALCMR